MYQLVGISGTGWDNFWWDANFQIPERIGKFLARIETTELRHNYRVSFQKVPVYEYEDAENFAKSFGVTQVQEDIILRNSKP